MLSLPLLSSREPFGLWLDADLCRGSSYTCQAFHNQPLTHHDFAVREVDEWTYK